MFSFNPSFLVGVPFSVWTWFSQSVPLFQIYLLGSQQGVIQVFLKRFCFSLFSVFSEMFFPLNYQDSRGVIQSRQDLSNFCDTRLSSRISFQVSFLFLSKSGFHSIPVHGRWSLRAHGLSIRSCQSGVDWFLRACIHLRGYYVLNYIF